MAVSGWLLMFQAARDRAQEGISEACTLALFCPGKLFSKHQAEGNESGSVGCHGEMFSKR